MATYQNVGLIDSRFVNQGGLLFEDLRDITIRNIFETLAVPKDFRTGAIDISAKFTQGNPSYITLTNADVGAITFSTQSGISGFKTEGFIDGNQEGVLALCELYNSEGDFIRDTAGNIIYGKTVNDGAGNLKVELYLDANLSTPFTGALANLNFGAGTPNQVIFRMRKRRNMFSMQDELFTGEFQVSILYPELTSDIRNIRTYLGIQENQTSVDFSAEPNSITSNTLEGVVREINSEVIGNLGNLLNQDKTSVVNALNDIFQNGTSHTEYHKNLFYGGILSGFGVVSAGGNTITIGQGKVWWKDDLIKSVPQIDFVFQDAVLWVWNGTSWVRPNADFTNKGFLLVLRDMGGGNFGIEGIEWNIGQSLEYPASGSETNLPSGWTIEDIRAFQLAFCVVSRSGGVYSIQSYSERKGFLKKDWIISGEELRVKNFLFGVQAKVKIVKESDGGTSIFDVKRFSPDVSFPGWELFSFDGVMKFQDPNTGSISLQVSNGKVIGNSNLSNAVTYQDFLMEDVTTGDIGLFKILNYSGNLSPSFWREVFQRPEGQVFIAKEWNSGLGMLFLIGMVLQGANNSGFVARGDGELSLIARGVQIPLNDSSHVSLPAYFTSIMHALHDYAYNGVKKLKKVAYKGVGGSVVGNVLITDIPYDINFGASNFALCSINGVEFDVGTTADANTVRVFNSGGFFAVEYPTGITPDVGDRVIIKYWLTGV